MVEEKAKVKTALELRREMNEYVRALWEQVREIFHTHEACLDWLYERVKTRNLMCCKYCNSNDFRRESPDRIAVCNNCNRDHFITAATLFRNVRNLIPWLGTIFVMENGGVITPTLVEELSGCALSTAQHILSTIDAVLLKQMKDSDPISSGHFLDLFIRRSDQTRANEHPVDEERSIHSPDGADSGDNAKSSTDSDESKNDETAKPDATERLDPAASFALPTDTSPFLNFNSSLTELESSILRAITSAPMTIDSICKHLDANAAEVQTCLSMLELLGAVSRLPGEKYALPNKRKLDKDREAASLPPDVPLADILHKIKIHHFGISRKYLQRYLAKYFFFADPSWRTGDLLRSCLESPHITRHELQSYVTPALVQVLPRASPSATS